MLEYNFSPPGLTEEGRGLFEERYGSGDIVATSQIRVDTTLNRLRRHIAKGESTVDLDGISDAAEAYLAEAIDAVPFDQAPSLTEYFALKTKHAMIRQIVFADTVFKSKDDYAERRELVNGLYGTVSGVLSEAMDLFDSSRPKSHGEKKELTGVINELTALALLNRRQTPEHLAVPSDITSDLYHATDLEYYTFPKGSRTSKRYHVQVKSRLGSHSKIRTPLGGLVISAHHMRNKSHGDVSFPTARAIIQENNGTISEDEETHLTYAIGSFETYLAQEIAKSDAINDAYLNLPPRIRTGVEKIFRDVIIRAMDENPDAGAIILEFDEPE